MRVLFRCRHLRSEPGPLSLVFTTVMFVAQLTRTLTVKLQVSAPMLPLPSRAVQVTSVSPREKGEPEGGTHVRVTVAQLSLAPALKVTGTEFKPADTLVMMFPGQEVNTGGSTSRTITLNEQLTLPTALLVVQVTTFVPSANKEPAGGLHVTEPSPLAVTPAVPPHWPTVL